MDECYEGKGHAKEKRRLDGERRAAEGQAIPKSGRTDGEASREEEHGGPRRRDMPSDPNPHAAW